MKLGTMLGVVLGRFEGLGDTVGGQPNAVFSGASEILLPDAIVSPSTVRV